MERWIPRPGPRPTFGEAVERHGGQLCGVPWEWRLDGLGPSDGSEPAALAPLWGRRAVGDAAICGARVVLVPPDHPAALAGRPRWVHPRPRRLLGALLRELFEPSDPYAGLVPGPAPGSWVHPAARLGDGVGLGPGVVVAEGVRVGAGCRIHAGAMLLHGVVLGESVVVGPGCVLGADGFGLDAGPGELSPEPLPQVGGVRVGDRVSFGAGTVVARGTLGDTRIGDGCRLDAQVQIGHNVVLGRGCILSAQVGVGGSARLGDGVWIGGQGGVADHCTLGRGVRVAAQAGVIGDWPDGSVVGGTPAVPHRSWLRAAARARRAARGEGGGW